MTTTLLFIALFLYFLGGVLGLIYFLFKKVKLTKAAPILMVAANAIHLFSVLSRWMESGHLPVVNTFEIAVALIWATVFVYWLFFRKLKIPALDFTINFFAAFTLGFVAVSYPEAQGLVPVLRSYWLQIHVSCYIVSYGALTVPFFLAIFYLIKTSKSKLEISFLIFLLNMMFTTLLIGILVKSKVIEIYSEHTGTGLHWWIPFIIINFSLAALAIYPAKLFIVNRFINLLPPPQELDSLIYRLVGFGFPFLTFGLITGAIWANFAWGRYWGWDPKETSALVSWLIYAIYLHLRLKEIWRGKVLIWLTIIGFFGILFTWLVVNYLIAGLHSYSKDM